MATLVLAPIPNISNLKECSPNLMPFNIEYSGPAPISTYLLVQPASETVGAPPEEYNGDDSTDGKSGNAKASCSRTVTMEASKDNAVVEAQELPPDKAEMRLPLVDATESQPSHTTRLSLRKRVTDATTRFISSFRGRTIQGLKVQLPPGYVGVVLKADGKLDETSKASGKATDGKKGKAVKTKVKGRSTRNSARVIDVDAEEENNMDNTMSVDEQSIDPGNIRTLVPVSQFSSFVLWHADHPVDEGRDEYFRSLTEWTRLAHEVRMRPLLIKFRTSWKIQLT